MSPSSRRFLVPVASAAAVLVILAVAVFARSLGGGKDVGSPRLPALTINGGNGVAAAAEMTAGDAKMAAPAGGVAKVEIKGKLPAGSDRKVRAYRLERTVVTKADVVALAAKLGLKGEPQKQAGGWILADSGRFLNVDASPLVDWRMMPGEIACSAPPASGTSSGSGSSGASEPAVVVDPAQPQPAVTMTAAPPADLGTLQHTHGTATLIPDPAVTTDQPVESDKRAEGEKAAPETAGGPATTPVAPDCAVSSGVVSSGTACAVPDGAQAIQACETPEAKPAPSDAAARKAALALLDDLGVDTKDAAVRVSEPYDGVRSVSLTRRVDGRLAIGWESYVEVDVNGGIRSASGQLAKPVVAGEYPMLPPGELAQQVANTRMTTMMCEQKPGIEGCAPPPPIVITGAEAGLSVAHPMDWEKGEAYLLPSWLFTIEGDPFPAPIVAVPQQFRGDELPSDPNDLVRKGMPEPAPVPATDPGTIEPATPEAPPVATDGTAKPLLLPTNGWRKGDPGHLAALAAELQSDARGCLVAAGEGTSTPLSWPAGSAAEQTADGNVVVKNAEGVVVARTGEKVSAAGGLAPAPKDSPCGSAEHFSINDEGPYND